jgi:hypothetical protein
MAATYVRRLMTGVAVCWVTACAADDPTAATSESEAEIGSQGYLALGDSIAFGFNPVAAATAPYAIGAFVGYPEVIPPPNAAVNAACPGETSASLIVATAQDNGCHAWRMAGFAMHVDYTSLDQSQLQFSLAYLAAHPETRTVSVHIGVNELRLLQSACNGAYPNDPNAAAQCIAAAARDTITRVAQRVGYILASIRQTGFTGKLIVVTYYALDYSNPADVAFQGVVGLDRALVQVAQTPGLTVNIARTFTPFAQIAATAGGDPCAAGLLYRLPDGTCDIHPSVLGRAVIAAAVVLAVPASTIDLSSPNARF